MRLCKLLTLFISMLVIAISFASISSATEEDYDDRGCIRVQNDISEDEVVVIVHNLGEESSPSSEDVCTSIHVIKDETVVAETFSVVTPYSGTPHTTLLSYRLNGELYQKKVSNIKQSAIIKLSELKKQPRDNYNIVIDDSGCPVKKSQLLVGFIHNFLQLRQLNARGDLSF